MDLVHGSQMAFEPLGLSHRGKGIAFKTFFRGPENTPENYWFTLGFQENFYSPVHKHNFDQFRFGWKGSVSISPDITVQPSQLCYHPEGVEYGPQDDGPGPREVLVLQFGGASGQGFLSTNQLKAANEELSEKGRFEKGRYFQHEGDEHGKDGFEALWEHVNQGKKLVYPKGRYNKPILMDPEAFDWNEIEFAYSNSTVYKKTLGVFTEREVRADMWKLEKDATLEITKEHALQFLFVVEGKGGVNGQHWEKESACRLQPGERAAITTETSIGLLRLVVPMLS